MSDLIFGIDNIVLTFFVIFIICIIGLLAYSVKGTPALNPPRSASDVAAAPRRIGSDQYGGLVGNESKTQKKQKLPNMLGSDK